MGLRERKDISGPSVHQRLKSKLHHVKIKPPGTTTTWPRPCPPDLPSLSTKYNYGSDKGSLWYSLGNMHFVVSWAAGRVLLVSCVLTPTQNQHTSAQIVENSLENTVPKFRKGKSSIFFLYIL